MDLKKLLIILGIAWGSFLLPLNVLPSFADETPLTIEYSVKTLQIDLSELGYYDDVIDDKFGKNTKKAIEAYQNDHEMDVDGVVTDVLLAKIKESIEKIDSEIDPADKQKITARALVNYSRAFLGTPYVYGSASPKGFDCSGFTQYSFKKFGIDLPRRASEQYKIGEKVEREDLQIGDLLFFTESSSKKNINHVGIYIGNNKMVHASYSRKVIMVADLKYFESTYYGAKRIDLE